MPVFIARVLMDLQTGQFTADGTNREACGSLQPLSICHQPCTRGLEHRRPGPRQVSRPGGTKIMKYYATQTQVLNSARYAQPPRYRSSWLSRILIGATLVCGSIAIYALVRMWQ